MTRMVHCVKLGKEAEGMKFPPLPNELGKRIFENVSQEAWNAWTRHQTMLINENRLSLADPRARIFGAADGAVFLRRRGGCCSGLCPSARISASCFEGQRSSET